MLARGSLIFVSLVAAVGTVSAALPVTTVAPAATGQVCSGTRIQNLTCPIGTDCCGTYEPLCYNVTIDQCCEWFIAATPCALDESCCGAQGTFASSEAFCCSAETVCCQTSFDGESACCAKESEKCCKGDGNGFCCGANEECCDYQCCGPDQLCCGGTCCDKTNQVCGSDSTCQYITQPPTYHPGPYANWSTVWSSSNPMLVQLTRTEYGLLVNNVPQWLAMLDPKTGSTIWNITRYFNVSGKAQFYNPVALTNNLTYIAGFGIDIKHGRVLWQENATIDCTTGLGVFPDGPTSVILTCCVTSLSSNDVYAKLFGIRATDGTARFTRTLNVTNSNYNGVQAVARHMIVFQNDFVFYGIGSLSGKTMWNYTVPIGEDYLPNALNVPASDAFVFTQVWNATALRLESGTVLWTSPNLVSNGPSTTCQTVVKLHGVKPGAEVEAVVWALNNGSLGFTETRTGRTVLQFPVQTYCQLTHNDDYLWVSYLAGNVTAVSLKTTKVAWQAVVPNSIEIHAASPTNNGPYVRMRDSTILRLDATGKVVHKFDLLPQAQPPTVAQYSADNVVIMFSGDEAIAFELPHE